MTDVMELRDQLVSLLHAGGFELDKWAATNPALIPANTLRENSPKALESSESVMTLGLIWNPTFDHLSPNAPTSVSVSISTIKRQVLSGISRLFDPLGWMAPNTVAAKILMQDFWISRMSWDEPLLSEMTKRWADIQESWASLTSLTVDRWLGCTQKSRIEIHVFSDASKRAYYYMLYMPEHTLAGVAVGLPSHG